MPMADKGKQFVFFGERAITREHLWVDFCTFSKTQLWSGDLDPTYPVLRRLYELEKLPLNTALWRTFLYVTFYNLRSAEIVWTKYPEPTEIHEPLLGLPTGVERRGFRGNDKARLHINYAFHFTRGGQFDRWVEACCDSVSSTQGWDRARFAFQQIPGNGGWASYKWSDLLKNVHGALIVAPDIGEPRGGEETGPYAGLARVCGLSIQECLANPDIQKQAYAEALKAVLFSGLDQFETALCDFNSLCRGHYYSGTDIDLQMSHVAECGDRMQQARLESFPVDYLGELGGWSGVDSERLKVYRDKGALLVR
jgi:hypothetical protein